MSEPLPTAIIRQGPGQRWHLPLIWLIPVIAAAIGAVLVWNTLYQRGPLITVTFKSAEGLQTDQSRVRHKEVDIGLVKRVALSQDLRGVVVTIRMNREAIPLLTDKARFWVVKPRLYAGSVSGLQTLVSGAYIELSPSGRGGEPRTEFTGLEDPPVLRADIPGRTVQLRAARIGSLNLGSPILFRDQTVGEVLGWNVDDMADSVTIHAFVREPFDRYLHEKSRFWTASGASVQLGGTGLQVQFESLRALFFGGIAFDNPAQDQGAVLMEDNRTYPLFASKEAADAASFTRSLPFVAYFRGSVAGLSVGASVTLRGIRIGEVTSVGLEYAPADDLVVAPVRFMVEPDRIAQLDLPIGGDLDQLLRAQIARGFRARLDSSSLITGQKQIVLDIFPGAPRAEFQKAGDTYVLPTYGDGGDDLAGSASALMARLQAIPFESIGKNLDGTLAGLNGIAHDPGLRQSIEALREALASARSLMTNLDSGTAPVLQRLPALTARLDDVVRNAGRLIASADAGYGANSAVNRDIARVLAQVSDAARSIRQLADLLARNPEALIRGRGEFKP